MPTKHFPLRSSTTLMGRWLRAICRRTVSFPMLACRLSISGKRRWNSPSRSRQTPSSCICTLCSTRREQQRFRCIGKISRSAECPSASFRASRAGSSASRPTGRKRVSKLRTILSRRAMRKLSKARGSPRSSRPFTLLGSCMTRMASRTGLLRLSISPPRHSSCSGSTRTHMTSAMTRLSISSLRWTSALCHSRT